MIVYSLWWHERGAHDDTLDDVFPDEESARKTANQILVQDNIDAVYVYKCHLTEFGLRVAKLIYQQEKKQ